MPQSPFVPSSDLTSVTILIDGSPMKDVYQVARIQVTRAINKIPAARFFTIHIENRKTVWRYFIVKQFTLPSDAVGIESSRCWKKRLLALDIALAKRINRFYLQFPLTTHDGEFLCR